MAKKSKPVAELAEQHSTGGIPETHPQEIVEQVAASMAMPGDAAEPVSFPPEAMEFNPEPEKESRWAKLVSRMSHKQLAGAIDNEQNIRVDRELDRMPGRPYPRVLLTAPDDAKFSPEERMKIKQNGFTFDDPSWAIKASNANYEMALRLANEIKAARGEDKSRAFYV